MKQKKTKKEKPVYIDDGSTVVDLSGLDQTKSPYSLHPARKTRPKRVREPGRLGAIWQTYWESVKMMLLPMLIVIGAISIIFLLLWFLF